MPRRLTSTWKTWMSSIVETAKYGGQDELDNMSELNTSEKEGRKGSWGSRRHHWEDENSPYGKMSGSTYQHADCLKVSSFTIVRPKSHLIIDVDRSFNHHKSCNNVENTKPGLDIYVWTSEMTWIFYIAKHFYNGISVIFQVEKQMLGYGRWHGIISHGDGRLTNHDLLELGFDPMMFNLYAMISTLNIIFAVLEECWTKIMCLLQMCAWWYQKYSSCKCVLVIVYLVFQYLVCW